MLRMTKTIMASAILATGAVNASAAEKEAKVDPANRVFLYIPDLIVDLFDVPRLGVAVGPALGAELTLTEYAKIGAYGSYEAGIAWMGRNNDWDHAGGYATASFGPWRTETDADADLRFYRNTWDVRGQLAVVLVHGYAGINLQELGDFFAGIVCCDPSDDSLVKRHVIEEEEGEDKPRTKDLWGEEQVDKDYDSVLGTTPLHRLGRGLSNVVFGLWEIPQNWFDVTEDQGHAASATYGTVRGVGRFVVREVVGVYEIFTFPVGGRPIIKPEYPWMPHEEHPWEFNWN